MSTHYVYLIQHGGGSIKIGVSNDPENRCKQLQTGNQRKLRVVAKFPFNSRSEAIMVERMLHQKFSHKRMHGEWFHRTILREFKHRKKLFPEVFNGDGKMYHTKDYQQTTKHTTNGN